MVGNKPNFTNIDVLRAFFRFEKQVGRKQLVKELGLGEGTLRTILSILKDNGLITSHRTGHVWSAKGKKLNALLAKRFTAAQEITLKSTYPKMLKCIIVVKQYNKNISLGVALRDVAIKNNAEAALILIKKENLVFPDSTYKVDDAPAIEKFTPLHAGDIVVISCAHRYKDAETGAYAIALELVDRLEGVFSRCGRE